MGRAKNAAIAVVLLILAFLVILVIVTAVREYNASHQKPKDPNSDNPVSDDPKHKKIPTDYFISAGGPEYLRITDSVVITGLAVDPPDINSNPEKYTWTLGDSLEYVVENEKPVTITFKQYGETGKVANFNNIGSTVTVGKTSGQFLIKKIDIPYESTKQLYFIIETGSAGSDELYWGLVGNSIVTLIDKKQAAFSFTAL
jgi:hypothetical protein